MSRLTSGEVICVQSRSNLGGAFEFSRVSDNIGLNGEVMTNKTTHTVIIGGGFGGLFTALDLAGTGKVTLISDEDHFLFSPMLYEYFSGEVEKWHIAPNHEELLDERVNFIRDEVTNIDLDSRSVTLKNQSEDLSYDVLVVAPGGVTNYAGVPGAEEFSIPFR